MPVRRERLTVERIVGAIFLTIFLETAVGIGSRSQDKLDDCDSKLVISSRVTGVNEYRGVVRVVSGGKGWEKDWFEG